jgi:hypothetical protein
MEVALVSRVLEGTTSAEKKTPLSGNVHKLCGIGIITVAFQ